MNRILVPPTSLTRGAHHTGIFLNTLEWEKSRLFRAEPPVVDRRGFVVDHYDALCVEAAIYLGIKRIWVVTNWSE